MGLEILEIETRKKYTDIRSVFDEWAKKKPNPAKTTMYAWLNKINTANTISSYYGISPDKIQLQVPVYRKSGGYEEKERNKATVIDAYSPENHIAAVIVSNNAGVLKKKSLIIGNDEKKPKWFYAHGLNETYEEIRNIEDINTILLAVPKNTIITKKDINVEKNVINNPSKRNKTIREIKSMNRYIYDESKQLQKAGKSLEIWQLPHIWNNTMEFAKEIPITTSTLNSLFELAQGYNISLSELNKILMQ